MAVIRRQRTTDWDKTIEPVKIVEPERRAEVVEESEEDDEGGDRSSRAASGRVDYQAVCERFTSGVTNRKTAIRAMCVTCMGGMVYEVAKCTSTKCPLFEYRMGENPNDARTIAAKQKREAQAAAKATPKAASKPPAASRAVRRTRG
jgi:hypothetical protein